MREIFSVCLLASALFGQQIPPLGKSGPSGCENPGRLDEKTHEWIKVGPPFPEGAKWTQPWEHPHTFTCIKGKWFNAQLEADRKERERRERHENDLRNALLSRPLTKPEMLEVVRLGRYLFSGGLDDGEQSFRDALLQQFLIQQIAKTPDCKAVELKN